MIEFLAWPLLAVVTFLVLGFVISAAVLTVLLVRDALHAAAGAVNRLRGVRLPVPHKRPVG